MGELEGQGGNWSQDWHQEAWWERLQHFYLGAPRPLKPKMAKTEFSSFPTKYTPPFIFPISVNSTAIHPSLQSDLEVTFNFSLSPTLTCDPWRGSPDSTAPKGHPISSCFPSFFLPKPKSRAPCTFVWTAAATTSWPSLRSHSPNSTQRVRLKAKIRSDPPLI